MRGCYQGLAFACRWFGLQPRLHSTQDVEREEVHVQRPVQVGDRHWALQLESYLCKVVSQQRGRHSPEL